jgi:hypothetical protein
MTPLLKIYTDKEFMEDVKKLLEEGVDDYWWTVERDGHFSLLNRLRRACGLEEFSEKYLKDCQEYWRNL